MGGKGKMVVLERFCEGREDLKTVDFHCTIIRNYNQSGVNVPLEDLTTSSNFYLGD